MAPGDTDIESARGEDAGTAGIIEGQRPMLGRECRDLGRTLSPATDEKYRTRQYIISDNFWH